MVLRSIRYLYAPSYNDRWHCTLIHKSIACFPGQRGKVVGAIVQGGAWELCFSVLLRPSQYELLREPRTGASPRGPRSTRASEPFRSHAIFHADKNFPF